MSDELLRPAGATGFWTLRRLAAALAEGPSGGHSAAGRGGLDGTWAHSDRQIRAIATDSRTVGEGDAFVAIPGERFDGHQFLRDVVAKGARAVIVTQPERARDLGVPVFVVPNAVVALGALARYRRRAWGKPIVAVAGSNGKTSTKELLRSALGSVLEVHATTGNYNNQIGVPLSLLAVPDDADIAVIEIGTNAPGEVASLRAIAEPDIAVVTSIGEEHLEGFGDLAGVLAEEGRVFEGTGVGVVPASDPALVGVARRTARTVVTAGLETGDLHASDWHLDEEGCGRATVEDVRVQVPLRGRHNVSNAMLALAVARVCGIPLGTAAAGIAATPVPPMRTAWQSLGRAVLLNDAYNANPASMRAAIDLAASVGGGRQRVAILGSMRELGVSAASLHADIARRALNAPFDLVAGIGDFAAALAGAAPGDPRVIVAADVDDLWPQLAPRLAPDALILLKASRGVRLERLVPLLTDWASSSCSITSSCP